MLLLLLLALPVFAQQIRIDLAAKLAPLEIDRVALGQGGLSEQPMWNDRVNEVRMLHPRIIRLFVQEYFDLLPAAGTYHWDTLDASVDTIRKTGATPLMNIDFKPRVLFPNIDERIVDPSSYEQWDELIYQMVRHYKERGSGIQYWEVANEPDIGESGGCPYLFTTENYTRYYQHTVNAIRRADPAAKVGGPALANSRSPILPALLDFVEKSNVPLDFVSWHIYQQRSEDSAGDDRLRPRPSEAASGAQTRNHSERMEYGAAGSSAESAISALLHSRDRVSNERGRARLLVLLPYSGFSG